MLFTIIIIIIMYIFYQRLDKRLSALEANAEADTTQPQTEDRLLSRSTTPSANIQMNLGQGSLTAKSLTSDSINVPNINSSTGAVNIQGIKLPTGGELCINNVCIGQQHLQALKGDRNIFLQSQRTGRNLQDDDKNARFENKNKGTYESLRIRM